MVRRPADGLTLYEHALGAAMHDIVDAFRDTDDTEASRRAAREVTAWLISAYGRDAVRDLVELLAQNMAQLPAHSCEHDGAREQEKPDSDSDSPTG